MNSERSRFFLFFFLFPYICTYLQLSTCIESARETRTYSFRSKSRTREDLSKSEIVSRAQSFAMKKSTRNFVTNHSKFFPATKRSSRRKGHVARATVFARIDRVSSTALSAFFFFSFSFPFPFAPFTARNVRSQLLMSV